VDALVIFVAVVSLGTGAGAYALTMRDLVRRGRLHRKKETLLQEGRPATLADGRALCPECAEAILPHARMMSVLPVPRVWSHLVAVR